MQWHFPVASGTHLQVRLYLINQCGCTSGVGQRVFNVAIDGEHGPRSLRHRRRRRRPGRHDEVVQHHERRQRQHRLRARHREPADQRDRDRRHADVPPGPGPGRHQLPAPAHSRRDHPRRPRRTSTHRAPTGARPGVSSPCRACSTTDRATATSTRGRSTAPNVGPAQPINLNGLTRLPGAEPLRDLLCERQDLLHGQGRPTDVLPATSPRRARSSGPITGRWVP